MRRVACCTRVRWSETITIGFCTYLSCNRLDIYYKNQKDDNFIKCKKMSREYAKSLNFFFSSSFSRLYFFSRESQFWGLENRLRHLPMFISSQTNLNLRKESLSIFIRETTRKRQTERVIIRTPRWGITLTFFDMMSEAQLSFQFFFFCLHADNRIGYFHYASGTIHDFCC